MIRNAAKALVINNHKILLNKCLNSTGDTLGEIQPNEIYYDLPGGGQNEFETLEEAIQRECLEETGYDVATERLAAIYEQIYMDGELRKTYPNYVHKIFFVFLCHIMHEEMKDPKEVDRDQIETVWVDLKDIDNINLHPAIISKNLQLILSTEKPIFLGSSRV